ncbi:MAG TPA: S8 family serine peptidase [Streptosporangiaceae bacterium]|jgi:type VII secretion-associated serine protease mycosin|nr:S8 family serine peptidase [Streptosporangiaceae bacterium]
MTPGTILRAGGVLCASLTLSATLSATPATTALAATRPGGLPGPAGDCPGSRGVAVPAATPWAQQALSFASVWPLTRGAGVTVAVVDSGVDANPQFGNRIIEGPDLASGLAATPADADCVGHGTSVASIIAAAPVAGVSFAGVAPAADVLSVKITNSDTFASSVAAQAVRAAVTAGAQVINLSLATVSSPALASAVQFAQASNVVVVAAAGNDNPDGAVGPFYPAAYPGVLSVGAVGPDGSLASFSDTRTPVSVTAPGADVTAAYPGVFPKAYNPGSNGTSFATAFVSGAAALVRAAHPDLDQAEVVARITATANGAAGPGTGHGLVNPVQAVTAVLPATGAGSGVSSPGRVQIDRAPRPDRAAASIALPLVAVAGGLAALVVAAAVIVPAGRRRHWSPGPPSSQP